MGLACSYGWSRTARGRRGGGKDLRRHDGERPALPDQRVRRSATGHGCGRTGRGRRPGRRQTGTGKTIRPLARYRKAGGGRGAEKTGAAIHLFLVIQSPVAAAHKLVSPVA